MSLQQSAAKGYVIPSLLNAEKLISKMPSFPEVKKELRFALKLLTNCRLTQSAKWIGQLLRAVTSPKQLATSYLIKNFIDNNSDPSLRFDPPILSAPPNEEQEELLLLGRSLFDLRQYRKCCGILQPAKAQGCGEIDFLYYYSLWMFGQFRKQEQIFENQGTSKPPNNPSVSTIIRELWPRHQSGTLDQLSKYVLGLALKQSERRQDALRVLSEVLLKLPWLWSCWLQICRLLEGEGVEQIGSVGGQHWLRNFYISSWCLQKERNQLGTELNYGLLCFFKSSGYLMNQVAHSFYNNQEFNLSLQWFQKLRESDPYRFQNMDTYSNILYIKEQQGELANLALRCFQTNKYCPQTCCVMGNYYSIMGQHYKAVLYFRKALRLDRSCLAAWTLMGHQYLEMKNIPGAIEAYRQAVEIDAKDFRAWYGLGQTYELQNMNHYALYYFTRAVQSRPRDARMWSAMASCYQRMDKKLEARKCFERAQNCRDREGIAIHKLAKMYSLLGLHNKAVQAFTQNLRRKDELRVVDKEVSECLVFLARHFKEVGQVEQALGFARRLYDFQGQQREEASSLLQELNSMMDA